MSILTEWREANASVSDAAFADLKRRMGHCAELTTEQLSALKGKGESFVQSTIRMAGPQHGYTFFRNNVGALKDERGIPVRYGLANDTPALNKVVKSSDLIGWRTIEMIDPVSLELVKVAQFAARECKKPEWVGFNPNDEREKAQQRFIELVICAGGDAAFTNGSFPV